MLDFYLIVSDYRAAYDKRWLAAANRLIPPNVFYFEHDGLAAKYAVLSEADFDRLNGPETSSVSSVGSVRTALAAGVVARTKLRASGRSTPSAGLRRRCWLAAAEGAGREAARSVAASFRADLFGRAARRASGTRVAVDRRFRPAALQPLRRRRRWRRQSSAKPQGELAAGGASKAKRLSVLRLAKASATFAGRRGLHRVEDQPARRDRHPIEAVAAAASAACRDQPLAAAAEVRGGSLAVRASAAETALASAPTVNGLRSSSWPRSSSLSPSPT